jgi:tetratricopeptide (TPR) repeat protein
LILAVSAALVFITALVYSNSFDKAVSLKPVYPEAYNNLGVALIRLGKKRDALAAFQKAVRQKPDLAPARKNLGRVCREIEREQSQPNDRMKSDCPALPSEGAERG